MVAFYAACSMLNAKRLMQNAECEMLNAKMQSERLTIHHSRFTIHDHASSSLSSSQRISFSSSNWLISLMRIERACS
jgi:hypothetical protein